MVLLVGETRLTDNRGMVRSEIGAASFMIPQRSNENELLDQGAGSLADVRANLHEMWRFNQLFAGVSTLTRYLNVNVSQPMRVVDVGSGSGNLALALCTWAQQHDVEMVVYPLDFSARHLAIAQETVETTPNVQLLQADGLALPFAPDSIDYFVSSLFLHHFSPESLVALLRETYRLARRGIIMSDIVRGHLPLAAFRVTQPLLARHFLTRHDGILSIKRGYTPQELTELAHEAGLLNVRVVRHFPWRMTLVADKPYV